MCVNNKNIFTVMQIVIEIMFSSFFEGFVFFRVGAWLIYWNFDRTHFLQEISETFPVYRSTAPDEDICASIPPNIIFPCPSLANFFQHTIADIL